MGLVGVWVHIAALVALTSNDHAELVHLRGTEVKATLRPNIHAVSVAPATVASHDGKGGSSIERTAPPHLRDDYEVSCHGRTSANGWYSCWNGSKNHNKIECRSQELIGRFCAKISTGPLVLVLHDTTVSRSSEKTTLFDGPIESLPW